MKLQLNLAFMRALALVIAGMLMLSCSHDASENGQEGADEESIFSVKKDKPNYYKVKEVDLGDGSINAAMATMGKETFETKCSACHKYDERYTS
jgi:cytochrome c5